MGSLLILVAAAAFRGVIAFDLPDGFEGLWSGTPSASILGPFDPEDTIPFVFGVSKTSNDFYVMGEDITYDPTDKYGYTYDGLAGWQRIYVERSGPEEGALWYCGALRTFVENATAFAGQAIADVFRAQPREEGSSSVTFCWDETHPNSGDQIPFYRGVFPTEMDPFCSGCSCGTWVMAYDAEADQLSIDYDTAGTLHLRVVMDRVGPAPEIKDEDEPLHEGLRCNFETSNDNQPLGYANLTSASGCPFARNHHARVAKANQVSRRRALSEDFDHCYTMNHRAGVRLEWSIDTVEEKLTMRMSASFESPKESYVAVGFRPIGRDPSVLLPLSLGIGNEANFGMRGADIVLGHAEGARTMFAENWIGTPIDVSTDIFNVTVIESVVTDDRLAVTFSRPLKYTGMLASTNPTILGDKSILDSASDMMWAVGSMVDGVGPAYHSVNRGYRYIDWASPYAMDLWEC